MYHTLFRISFVFFSFAGVFSLHAHAQAPENKSCTIEDRACILDLMKADAALIDNVSWRDQTYREIAKTLAFEGNYDGAIELIPLIETADTKAMTIRGIGMAAAHNKIGKEEYTRIFSLLRAHSESITHEASFAIALTYIAMAQAFAGDNEGAWKTASEMQNEALRHKAYAETAEIQAQNGDFESARKSIEFIESLSFRNKSYNLVAKILADKGLYAQSFDLALLITNPYKKTETIQYILDAQKPRQVPNEK